MRYWLLGSVLGLMCFGAFGCSTVLPDVNPHAKGPMPPAALGAFEGDGPVASAQEWSDRRAPLLRQAFQSREYGALPPPRTAEVLGKDAVTLKDPDARIEQWTVAVTDGPDPLRFHMVVVMPKEGQGPFPTIVMQNFCGNRSAFKGRPTAIARPLTPVMSACDDPKWDPVIHTIFGRYIDVPPYQEILSHGCAVAMFYAGDVVADEPRDAAPALARLAGPGQKLGAIGAWAWLYSRAYDALAADPRIDAHKVAIWGHSRNGKAALLAAAFDPRIAAVIAHQSGRGGAALNSGNEGETISEMMKNYPHWFPDAYAAPNADPAFDQHQLLALIAPRPVLLGNGRRDAHADPIAAFRAAEAADPVYELFGSKGLDQKDPMHANMSADIAYFMRGGLHGVTGTDWRYFLEFLDDHFKSAPTTTASRSAG